MLNMDSLPHKSELDMSAQQRWYLDHLEDHASVYMRYMRCTTSISNSLETILKLVAHDKVSKMKRGVLEVHTCMLMPYLDN